MSRFALVIDDNRDTADSLTQMLILLGYETRVAYGPLRAIEGFVRRFPDVILLDIHMQGVSGVEICRYLRRDPRTAHVPVVAISSDTQESLVADVRAAGANAFLPKPIDIEALERALVTFFPPDQV